jgi:hypothetical protein
MCVPYHNAGQNHNLIITNKYLENAPKLKLLGTRVTNENRIDG